LKDTSKQRISEELALYKHLKSDNRIEEIEGGGAYYLISDEWIKKWRNFVQERGPLPGPVYNAGLARLIHEQRGIENDNIYQAHDNQIGLNENKLHYVISKDFWQMFESRYHCDVIIQIRKYTTNKYLLPKPIRVGEVWSAYPVDLDGHYDPIKARLEAMPIA